MYNLGMCCVFSECVFQLSLCSYMYGYRQACLRFPVLAIFVSFSHLCLFVGLFVWLPLRSFAFGGKARPSLGGFASCLFLSFSVCIFGGLYFYFFCFWPLSVCLSVLLVLCLASACLGQTVIPPAGRDCPPVKAPSKPIGLGRLLKPLIFMTVLSFGW